MRSDYVSPVKSIGHGITTMQDLENNAEVWCVMLEQMCIRDRYGGEWHTLY